MHPQRVTTGWMVRIGAVRVGIVDVGANTLRLLVAARENGRLVPLREQRVQLGLGDEIERSGALGEEKLAEAAAVAKAHVSRARKLGCDRIDVLVTSPGRQARNGGELASILRDATGAATKVLRPEEEGELAWYGAVATADYPPASVAVCDVGGGSTQLVVGTVSGGPARDRTAGRAWRHSRGRGAARARGARGRDRLRADAFDDASVAVEHERLTLLLARADECVTQSAVTAQRNILIEQRANELHAVVELPFLPKLVTNLDLEAAGLREWLDGLDTAVVRAGQDARQRVFGERLDQIGRLLQAAFVDRPPAIVAWPFIGLARASMANEQRHPVNSSDSSTSR